VEGDGFSPTSPISPIGEPVGVVGGEPGPRLVELPHGDDGIDGPGPMLGSTAAVLNPDGADLGLCAIVFPDDAANEGLYEGLPPGHP
jgi:hypothetical protein